MQSVAPILGVADVDATVAYFVDTLGFTLPHPVFAGDGDEGGVYGIVHRDDASFHVQIRRNLEPGRPREEIETDAYVYVTDVDALWDEYTARGVTVFRPIYDEPYGMRDTTIETPDGHRIAFGSPLDD